MPRSVEASVINSSSVRMCMMLMMMINIITTSITMSISTIIINIIIISIIIIIIITMVILSGPGRRLRLPNAGERVRRRGQQPGRCKRVRTAWVALLV